MKEKLLEAKNMFELDYKVTVYSYSLYRNKEKILHMSPKAIRETLVDDNSYINFWNYLKNETVNHMAIKGYETRKNARTAEIDYEKKQHVTSSFIRVDAIEKDLWILEGEDINLNY